MKRIHSLAVMLAVGLLCSCGKVNRQDNALHVIAPYKVAATWVIDDQSRGLKREPFVAGIPRLLEQLTRDIPNADKGFRLLFSAQPFLGYSHTLVWKRKEGSGNWYYSQEFKAEGWLCPALLKFFSSPPKTIYIKAEAVEPKGADPVAPTDP